jgi:hypothetical protein
MSGWLLGGVAVIYAWVALDYLHAGRQGMALVFVGYALANFGFIWDLVQHR